MDRLSWQAKLMGLSTLVLGPSLLFQLFYVLPAIRNQQVEMTKTHQEETAHHIAWGLDNDLVGMKNTLIEIAGRAEFRNMDIVNQQQTVTQIAGLSPGINTLFVMDAEGWFVAGTAQDLSAFQKKSYTDKPYYIAAVEQGQAYFGAPRAYLDNTIVSTSVSVPIESDTGERVGLLLGTVWLNPLMERLKNYPLGEERAVFLVNRQGTVVAHSGIDLFALEEGPLSLDFSDRPLVQAIMAGEIGEAAEYEHEGEPYFCTYSILESNGWGVVVEAPMSVILARSEALAGRLLWVNAVLFVMALAVSLVFARQITAEARLAEEELKKHRDHLEELVEERSEALRESEEQFRTLAERSPNMIFINQKGRVGYANERSEEVMGYTSEEFYSPDFDFLSLIAPEHRDLVKTTFGRHMRGEEVPPYEYALLTKEGKRIEAILATRLIRFGGESAILGITTDITERKYAEERLERVSTAIESVLNDMLLGESDNAEMESRVLDACLAATDSAYGMVGKINEQGNYDTTAYASKAMEDCAFPEALAWELSTGMPIRGIWGSPMLHGEALICNDLEAHPDRVGFPKGHVPLHCFLGAPLKRGGKVVGMVAVANKPGGYTEEDKDTLVRLASVISVSRQHREALKDAKRTSADLEAAYKELREAQEQLVRREKLAVLGQLAGGVGHELRNPLGAIKSAAYFLNMAIEEPDPEVKETLEILEREVGISERIISSLLDFARPKPPTRRKTDINEVVRAALSRATVPENVEVVSQLDEALPTILADPDQLAQVFENIILNAIQAMPEGGRLTLKSKAPTPEWTAVSFTDTGVGIPQENMGKLFEPLFTTKAKGIGLGLAVVKTLVEARGGTIDVESEVGEGSTFTVRLPIGGREKE